MRDFDRFDTTVPNIPFRVRDEEVGTCECCGEEHKVKVRTLREGLLIQLCACCEENLDDKGELEEEE